MKNQVKIESDIEYSNNRLLVDDKKSCDLIPIFYNGISSDMHYNSLSSPFTFSRTYMFLVNLGHLVVTMEKDLKDLSVRNGSKGVLVCGKQIQYDPYVSAVRLEGRFIF